MNLPEFYILRHGETVWNSEGRMQGILHSPLTDSGVAQARQQAAILGRLDLTGFQFLSSPQGRAFQTAGIVLSQIAPFIQTDDRLREIGVGDWAGKRRSELWGDETPPPEGPDGSLDLYSRAPNGEGFPALDARCRDFLSSLDRPSVLVTHGITSRMIRSIALGLGHESLPELPGGQGNVFHLKNGVQTELV